ncbi:hypothetical protein [Haloarchaeobius litoreus]|uniref:MT0933-like antitoxin protein n=1 Tax=Haloarchaeobius litoreus TaxID=755306 RepID=A0ABD6DFT6_9EURY|nr:hypothetical protein [Haloarchaeobius litoreus]
MTDHQHENGSAGDTVDEALDSLRSKLDEFGDGGGTKDKAAEKGHELVDELEETITGLTGSNDDSSSSRY